MRTPKLGEPVLCGCCGATVGVIDQSYIDFYNNLTPQGKSECYDHTLNMFLGYDGCESRDFEER